MKSGWFIGDFTPSAYNSKDVEVNYRMHPKGESWPVHYHTSSTEVNLVISGKMTFQGITLVQGDIFIVEPFMISDPEFIEDTYVVCCRFPSVNDKVIL